MELNEFARSYLCLGLRINKHIPGYVEYYYGPPELKKKVDLEELISPRILLKDCKSLKTLLKKQDFEKKRYRFLDKTLTAIKTTLRTLNGEKIPYLEQVEKIFDIKPVIYDEFLYTLTSKAEKLYKGNGTLPERIKRYSELRKIPLNKLKTLFLRAFEIAQIKTNEIFPNLLPDDEKIQVAEVKDRAWTLYCWYKGNFSSIIEINIEKVLYWTTLLNNACHEGYPGHHTERTVKEEYLFRRKGYFESSISLIYSPEMVISEGIGLTAESVIFKPYESVQILLEEIYPNHKNDDPSEALLEQSEIRRGFMGFNGNLAYHKYVDKWSEDKLWKYARSYKVIPDVGIKTHLEFISDEKWAIYALSYQGERLITEKLGSRPSPKQFRKLLIEQTLPSDLI